MPAVTAEARTKARIGRSQSVSVGANFAVPGANPLGFTAGSWWDGVLVCRPSAANIDPNPREVSVTRVSRIPYHQNVYDLLQIEPGESPEAARMIDEHEAEHGLLPASVKEWYLVPNVVPLEAPHGVQRYQVAPGTLWYDYSEPYDILTLADILHGFATPCVHTNGRYVEVLHTWDFYSCYVHLTGSDDPRVWDGPDIPTRDPIDFRDCSESFSEFVAGQFTWFYMDRLTRRATGPSRATPLKSHHDNGLWLRSPDESFQPPVIDFLTDHFGEPERTPRSDNVTTYTYHPHSGTIRVTADEPALTGALSAWWIHADTPERLAEFATMLLPWGTLRETLRADTNSAREVLKRDRGV
jgi:hypothetical protein